MNALHVLYAFCSIFVVCSCRCFLICFGSSVAATPEVLVIFTQITGWPWPVMFVSVFGLQLYANDECFTPDFEV